MQKKVLIILGAIRFGGIEMWVRDLLQTIDRRRFEPVVCSLLHRGTDHRPELLAQYRATGIKLVEIKDRLNAYDPRLIWDIYRVIRQEKVDLVHVNDVVWGLTAAALACVPAIRHIHNDYKTAVYRPGFDQVLHRITPYFIATNWQVKNEVAVITGVEPNRIAVIYCGIDSNRFSPSLPDKQITLRQELGLYAQEQVVVTIGRLIPQKGMSNFLNMARQVVVNYRQPVRFLIVGEGPQRAELEAQVQALGLEQAIIFTGSRSDTPNLLALADLFVVSSLWEAGPITLLEAMAMGKPVVATPVGRVPELIKDGETGFVVPVGDPAAMADRVQYLLEQPDCAARLGQKAQQLGPTFDNKYEIKKLEDFYNKVLQSAS